MPLMGTPHVANFVAQSETTWTAADLFERFGAIPLSRIRLEPPPGSATEEDVIAAEEHGDRLCELVDGILVEKTMGTYESLLAGYIVYRLWQFLEKSDLGIALGADGMLRLAPGLVRIPDVSFISWERLPERQLPPDPIADLVPDLAIEVLSKGNTPEEMRQKLADYFAAGVRGVWIVDHRAQEVRVHTSRDRFDVLRAPRVLDGGSLLPGFVLPIEQIFRGPGHQDSGRTQSADVPENRP